MRHALITAGTKGLGKRVTEQLLKDGYSVTVTHRDDNDKLDAVKNEWGRHLERIQFIRGDVTCKEDLIRISEETVKAWGRIDALVMNAGPYIFERKKLIDYSEEEWNKMLDGNLNSAFYLLKQVIPIMRKQKSGRIIAYAFQGADHSPGWLYRSAFAAAKVGLVSLTKTIAIEEAENGITANVICPGKIVGEMKEASITQSRQYGHEETPIGRSGTGEDIGRTISFLCDENSDMITGAVLEVTGGMDVLNRFR
ncbi:short-chain dehydrogenase/reductase SDR [Evansella cellulosilytica DSM 2522]|uniref:Short-chain dehydrogenase/reductase SDR n=1 Tax=Evansella cellulosilytica (strain ATCC 21833 / DSM 2522 / FERM P-1141 / JCM 9156 / N-4) TaxID=649639 RepID=E6U135_EVAC2|nr:short-chain dehydrogenase/reductase SDR [Evansella cellulosilytica DSM 2522]